METELATKQENRITRRQNETDIIVVLDRSGSMQAVRQDMIGGLNQFVKEQKQHPQGATFSLVQFDTEYEIVCDCMKLADVGHLDLVPRGCTALLDAIGRTINSTENRLGKLDSVDKPSKVLFVIITDGHENSSHEFSKKQILEMITRKKTTNSWEFVFLGANQDAIDEGAQIGIGVNQAMTYQATPQGVSRAFSSLSAQATSYRTTGKYTFTDDDRKWQSYKTADDGASFTS